MAAAPLARRLAASLYAATRSTGVGPVLHAAPTARRRCPRRRCQIPGRRCCASAAAASDTDADAPATTTLDGTGAGSDTYRDSPAPESYLTNRGVVEGVWMFVRHGDRTPGRPLCPPHRRREEAAYWMTRLPYPDTAAAFQSFSERFPLDILPGTNQGKFIDVSRNPFGWLTQSGIEQLRDTGQRFFNRYNQHGYHFPQHSWFTWQDAARDFLEVWDVAVYSTNYLRTVMSVQSFLDGLLGTHCYPLGRDEQHRSYDPMVTQEPRVPDHSWASITKPGSDGALVSVRVRDLSNDPLNAFDRNPDLIAELVAEVMLSPDFLRRDAGAAPLAARLANVLPGLVRPYRSDFSAKSPSGINWVEAADHFVCRQAHGVDLTMFTDFEYDEGLEQTLAAMAYQTIAHLAWRFRMWYQNKRLLAAIAAPPLREIANQLLHTAQLRQTEKRPFVIYSCHDITILGLLYGIGADFLLDETSLDARFWPSYASHLVFELVRVQDGESHAEGMTSCSHVIRVLLNGKPVLSVDFEQRDASPQFIGHGPEQLLSIHDFLKLVSDLEDAGGHDYERLLGRMTD